MKIQTILILLLVFTSGLKIFSQISFLGFDQVQCNLLENHSYTYEIIRVGKWSTPGFIIFRDGVIVYHSPIAEHSPYFFRDFNFINDSIGFLVYSDISTTWVYRTSDYGQTWENIGFGLGGGFISGEYFGLYIVNFNTAFLITSLGFRIVVSRASEISQAYKIIDLDSSNIAINDTIYGDPFCIKDSLTFSVMIDTNRIDLKLNFQQLSLPTTSRNIYATANSIDVFPNPSSDYIKIHFNTEIASYGSIIVQDISGKIVIINELNDPFSEKIYIGDLPEGIYSIKILIENIFYQTKFIKINSR